MVKMKGKILTLFIATVCVSGVFGEQITRDEAIQFLKSKGIFVRKDNAIDHLSFEFSDEELKIISVFNELRTLHLNNAHVTTKGLKYLETNKNIEVLSLDNTKINDSSLEVVSKFKKLRILNLKSTKISDKGIKYLTSLRNLKELNLINTPITDKSLEYFGQIPSLHIIMIRGTKITKQGFDAFKKKFPTKYITFETEEEIQ